MLLIYKKIHTVNLTTVNEISIGAIINIVSNQCTMLVQSVFLLNSWIVPTLIVYTFGFLFNLFSFHCFMFLVAFIFSTFLTSKTAMKSKNMEKDKNEKGDKRI